VGQVQLLDQRRSVEYVHVQRGYLVVGKVQLLQKRRLQGGHGRDAGAGQVQFAYRFRLAEYVFDGRLRETVERQVELFYVHQYAVVGLQLGQLIGGQVDGRQIEVLFLQAFQRGRGELIPGQVDVFENPQSRPVKNQIGQFRQVVVFQVQMLQSVQSLECSLANSFQIVVGQVNDL